MSKGLEGPKSHDTPLLQSRQLRPRLLQRRRVFTVYHCRSLSFHHLSLSFPCLPLSFHCPSTAWHPATTPRLASACECNGGRRRTKGSDSQ